MTLLETLGIRRRALKSDQQSNPLTEGAKRSEISAGRDDDDWKMRCRTADEIMFVPCIPDLGNFASGVVLECAPPLARLFARSFPEVAVHGSERGAPLEWLNRYLDIAAKSAIGSLPLRVDRRPANFPKHPGYLRADRVRIEHYRDRLLNRHTGLNVGLLWQAGTRATRGELRSICIELMRPLFQIGNVHFVCLQYGLDSSEQDELRGLGMSVWEDAIANIDESAALISALDLVISVANTNVHLAGALGRPVWVLLNSSPEWRWRREGETTPWYPSAALIRPGPSGKWESVLANAAARLHDAALRADSTRLSSSSIVSATSPRSG